MSAATRRPYLGEDIHYATEDAAGDIYCKAAKITAVEIPTNWQELIVFQSPQPQFYVTSYDPGHRQGTWHYAH